MNQTVRCPPPMYTRKTSQRGVFLIEALIAIVVFSIGILALIGLQAVAIRETTESKMRSDASYLADKIVADLAATDLQTAAANGSSIVTAFNGNYTASSAPAAADFDVYGSWQTILGRNLPGGAAQVTIESPADPLNAARRIHSATITVTWPMSNQTRSFSQTSRLVD